MILNQSTSSIVKGTNIKGLLESFWLLLELKENGNSL